MAQWLSQTRKMNNHYQSAGAVARTPSWQLPYTAMAIDGVAVGDSFAFFPPVAFEKGCDHNTYTIPLEYPTEAPMYGGKYTDGDIDIYFGVYANEGGEVDIEPIDYTPTSAQLSRTFSYRDANIINGKPTVDIQTAAKTMAFSSMNGCGVLIPTIERYKYFYAAVNHGDVIPEWMQSIVANYPDVSGTFDKGAASSYFITGTNYYVPNVMLYHWFSDRTVKTCPGDHPIALNNVPMSNYTRLYRISGTTLSTETGNAGYGGTRFTNGCGLYRLVTGTAAQSAGSDYATAYRYTQTDSTGSLPDSDVGARSYSTTGIQTGIAGDCGLWGTNTVPEFTGILQTSNTQHRISITSSNSALFGFYRIVTRIRLQTNYQFWG